MEIVVFGGWFVMAIAVGVVASSRGRVGIGWFFLALLISPLLAGLLVFVLSNIKEEDADRSEQRKQQVEAQEAAAKIIGADVVISLDKLRQLKDKGIVSEI